MIIYHHHNQLCINLYYYLSYLYLLINKVYKIHTHYIYYIQQQNNFYNLYDKLSIFLMFMRLYTLQDIFLHILQGHQLNKIIHHIQYIYQRHQEDHISNMLNDIQCIFNLNHFLHNLMDIMYNIYFHINISLICMMYNSFLIYYRYNNFHGKAHIFYIYYYYNSLYLHHINQYIENRKINIYLHHNLHNVLNHYLYKLGMLDGILHILYYHLFHNILKDKNSNINFQIYIYLQDIQCNYYNMGHYIPSKHHNILCIYCRL